MLNPLLIVPLFTLVLCVFLFYNFVQNIGGFAAELTGGPNLQRLTAVSATALFDTMMKASVKGDYKNQANAQNAGSGQIKKDSGAEKSDELSVSTPK
jgi:hypothetical protein